MRGILLDVNMAGHRPYLLRLITACGLMEFWTAERVGLLSLAELGLPGETPDLVIWTRCQAELLVLLTDNRNADGPDSLGQALAATPPDSLPVFTVGSKDRFERDRQYALAVAERLVELVQDINAGLHRGVGRMYLPG